MIYLAYTVIAFTAIQLIVSFLNFIFKQKMKVGKSSDKMVSVLIPARNEEINITNILMDVMTQNHRNFEILVFDDESTDNTVEEITTFMKHRKNIRLIKSEGLPEGWLGKNHACHSLAMEAKGDYLLFIDADVRIKDNIIKKTVYLAKKHKLGLLSIFPKQIMNSWGEYATVPIMNYILLTLLPLILVRKIGLSSLAAANGQYMLFETQNYMKLLPHKTNKSEKVEDIKIARYFKKKNLKTACLASEPEVKCNMYNSYQQSTNGFSKNVTTFFGGSTLLALVFWGITTIGFTPILFVYGARGLAIYLAAIITIRLFVSITSNQSVNKNIFFLVAQQVSLGIMIIKSIKNNFTKVHIWKGRNVLQS